MHGRISRWSHDPADRYAALYHLQGAMITDADLNRGAEIARTRVDALGDDMLQDGAPREGGCVTVGADGRPTLRPGVVYADGVRGVWTRRNPGGAAGLQAALADQVDLPEAPPIPAAGDFVVYADLWQRAVSAVEDPDLTDPGLHGALTAFAGRTMVQLKWAPLSALADLRVGTGAWPHRGDATLTAVAAATPAETDPCDPCATSVTAAIDVANALLRLEVVDVEGAPDAPSAVTLAWSAANAAEHLPHDPAAGLTGGAFEYLDVVTEAHRGVFANPAQRKRSVLSNAWAPAPVTDGARRLATVRRWDGFRRIEGAPLTAAAGFAIAAGGVELTLVTAGRRVVAGDCWLVELRRFASPDAARVRVLSPTPVGVRHHVAVLFRVSGGQPVPLDDAERRRLTAPTLTDIPAVNIALDPATCPKLFGAAPNVQAALSALCEIQAADIGFVDGCPDLYAGATTVQQALDRLCDVDRRTGPDLRLLFDWGVLCGVRVSKGSDPGTVRVGAGHVLDAGGVMVPVPAAVVDLNGPDLERIDLPDPLTRGEYCLAVSQDGEGVAYALMSTARARSLAPRTYDEAVAACEQTKNPFPDYVFEAAKESQAARLVIASYSGGGKLAGTYRVAPGEAPEVERFLAEAQTAIRKDASEAEIARLDFALEEADRVHDIPGAAGAAAAEKRGLNYTAKFGAMAELDKARVRDCACELAFPSCPTDRAEPRWTPLACIDIGVDRRVLVQTVCEWCCRKQASTPRTLQYWGGRSFAEMSERLKGRCCDKPPPPRDPPPVVFDPPRVIPPIREKWPPWRFEPRQPGVDPFDPLRDPVRELGPAVGPDVFDLNIATATDVLAGRGLSVQPAIDLDGPGGLSQVVGRSGVLGLDQPVRPGDKVALVTRGGVAKGYVVTERGDGVALFDRKAPSALGGVGAAPDLGAVTAELGALTGRRDALQVELGALTQSLGGLSAQRSALAGEVEGLRAELDGGRQEIETLAKSRDALLADSRKALADLTKARDAAVAEAWAAQPVGVLTGGDTRLAGQLAGRNIRTVGDLTAAVGPEETAVGNVQIGDLARRAHDLNRRR